MKRASRARGVTLVELIVSIVIVGVAVAGILSVMNLTTRHSADPMIQQQAQLIAESYLEEILLKKFVDPTADSVCPAAPALRTNYDNVCDYNGLNDTGARNQFGTVVTGLESYNVAVTVTPSATNPTGAVVLDALTNDYTNGYIRILRVDVVVTHGGFTGVSVPLTGYRTHYNCNATIAVGQCRPLT